MMWIIQHRQKALLNTDPQRRCYDGHLFSSKIVWSAWSELERWPDERVALQRQEFWRDLNAYAVSQRGRGALWELRVVELEAEAA